MCRHMHTCTPPQDWAFLSLAKPQTAENQAEVEQSNPEKGEEMKGVRMRCMLGESSSGEQGSQVLKKKIETI